MANDLASHNKIIEHSNNFRDYLIPRDHPRLRPSDRDARTHSSGVLSTEEIFLTPVARGWKDNYAKPYHGFTTDGNVASGIWKFEDGAQGPTEAMVRAARGVLEVATEGERKAFCYGVEAREWRAWSNPEVIVVDAGLRIDEMGGKLREAVHGLLKASLSDEGYAKVQTAMVMNGFLGELTGLRNVLNKDSYHFCLFGDPTVDGPWGFNVFGHHCCLNVLSLAGEVVVGPFFLGAEPNVIDEGEHKGLDVLSKEEAAGLAFMKGLNEGQRAKATLQGDINDIDGSTMPEGRWNPADLRGLGGAHQDNRVVPLEGLCAKEMSEGQRRDLLAIVRIYNEILPKPTLELFMKRVEAHLDETYFGWIGPVNDKTPFYYRVHSPVVMDEFDHHNGVWLANALPKKYHIHTIQRLPNRGDYGTALWEDWKRKKGQGTA